MKTIELLDGGWIIFDESFLPNEQATRYLECLRATCAWSQHMAIFGRPQPRLTAAYGDAGLTYRYSGTTHAALPWLPELLEIKARVERVHGKYNYCLLNLYRDGRDSMGWHADDEKEIHGAIASVSLGATRKFDIRHNTTKEKRSFALNHGSLAIMGGTMQQFWKHHIPKTREAVGERINLTFRHVLLV